MQWFDLRSSSFAPPHSSNKFYSALGLSSVEDFTKHVKVLCGDNRKTDNWLDNKQVYERLKISLCTLTYQDSGKLPFSQIGRKCDYKVTDIELFINKASTK